MGVVKNQKNKTKKPEKKEVNGKAKTDENGKVKKKKTVSCLQCIKPVKDGGLEGKYRVAAPELMQDTFMSDSEDEGGEVECPIQQQQQYRYMNSEAGTLHRAKPLEDSVTDGHLWPSNNDKKVATMERQPLDIGFLVSFVVDARGGAMKAKRRGGVRIIVPPAACAAPTRVTCRAATRRAPAAAPPPLMEGEALASRLLELQPQGAKFLAPVIIEVPIFTSPCKEREIIILRSDTGETWQDHYLHNNDNPMIQEALQRERQEYGPSGETLGENGERVTRIVTCDFPHYLACVSRVTQEVHIIGPEGGTVSSKHIPQVQALFPAQALTKRIRVGLQAHGAAPQLVARVLPRHAAVSPVITVEPRRRKFHKSITLTAPLPQHQGTHDKQPTSNLRLLCSIMGGQARAVWEDVTGSTPLTITDDCASFTTTVSARFWLMNCQNVSDATKLATELYRDMLLVPFEVRIVVLGKRLDALEGRLLVMYITDRYAYETLLQQEHYTEVAHSTSVRFLDGKDVYLEFSGNLVPVTKSGSQPMLAFEAFKDNRVEFTVRVKHHEESPAGRIYFMNEPKVPKGEQSQTPACVLDVELPERIAPRAGKSHTDYLNLDQSGFDALKDELSFHWGDHNNSFGPGSLPYHPEKPLNGHGPVSDRIITNGDIKYPTKDTEPENKEKDKKPKVNGDTLPQVDSNKTKATFDSDEDKTPINTLEKGKKKESGGGGFLGGLAGKVKNVFGHSDDKGDEKESSPKPQPKPRESKEKEKTPPKPAPRIIKEDLLDKVEDMFKDLHSKPPRDDEDLESQVYQTKLVVDEDAPGKTEEEKLYEQYALMQPVDTPLCNQKADPFIFYVGCCEGKYKAGQKHRHDETSNLLDIIEQEKFTTQEKLQEISDGLHKEIIEDLSKLEKEKDNIAQKTSQVTEDFIVKKDAVKGEIKNKGHEIKSGTHNFVNDLQTAASKKLKEVSESGHKAQDNATSKASEVQKNVAAEIDEAKSAAKGSVEHAKEKNNEVEDAIANKTHTLDFLAQEQAEAIRLGGTKQIKRVEKVVSNAANNAAIKIDDVKSATTDSTERAKENIDDAKDAIVSKAHTLDFLAQEQAEAMRLGETKQIKKVEKLVSNAADNVAIKIDDVKSASKDSTERAKEKLDDVKDATVSKAYTLDFLAQEQDEAMRLGGTKQNKRAEKLPSDAANNVAIGIDNLKSAAKNSTEHAKEKIDEVKDAIVSKAHTLDFLAQEQAEAMRLGGSEQIKRVEKASSNAVDNIKNKAQVGANAVADSVHNAQEELKQKAQDVRASVEKTFESVKEDLSESSESTKELSKEAKKKAKKEAKKKSKEGKNFFSGLVSNIFGSKDEVENEIKSKVADTKESANNLLDQASAKKDELMNQAAKKQIELKEGAENLVQKAYDKTQETNKAVSDIEKSVHDKTEETRKAAEIKAGEVQKAAENKILETKSALHGKVIEIKDAAQHKAVEVEGALHDKSNEVKTAAMDARDKLSNKASEVNSSISDAKDAVNNKANEFGSAISQTKDAIHDRASEIKGALQDKTNEAKTAISDARDTVKDKASEVGSTINETNHAIYDKASEVKDALQNKTNEVGLAVNATKDVIHNKASEVKDTICDKTNKAKEAISDAKDAAIDKTVEIKDAASNKVSEAKDAVQHKASVISGTIHDKAVDLKDAAKNQVSEIKEKSSEVTGAIQDKTVDLKDAASNKLVGAKDAVQDKASEISDTIQNKSVQFKDTLGDKTNEAKDAIFGAFSTVSGAFYDKTSEVKNTVQSKTHEATEAVQNKTSEYKDAAQVQAEDAVKALHDTTKSLQHKKDEFGQTLYDKKEQVKDAAQSELDRIRQEAEHTTNEIKKKAEDTLNAAADKKGELQANVNNKCDEWQQAGKDDLYSLQRSSKEAFGHVQESALGAFDKVESSAKDRVIDAKDTWEDLQSSTRDTYADFRDDVHNLGNSAQDTLHSFQSSAGNTFDSLDDSTKEVFGGIQTAANNAEATSKELFGETKDTFEGFQVSADNKLEEIKGAGKERLEDAGQRLGEATEEVVESARGAERSVAGAVASEADRFTTSLNNLGSSVFGASGKGLMKDSTTKLLESEKSQSSPHKKSSGIPKLKKKK